MEKAPKGKQGGNTKVAGQGYLNTDSVQDSIDYLTAMCGYYEVPEDMIKVWAEEVSKNNEWVSSIGGDPQEHQFQVGIEYPELIIEPGRSIVGRAGVAIYTVGVTKNIPNVRTYVSLDGGMGDNIRPALYDAQYEAVAANRMSGGDITTVTLAGKYCETGDILVKDIALPSLDSGDIVAIPASGAYCIAMSSNYNMNPRPEIVMVSQGTARVIRKRETYKDLMALDLP